MVGAISRRKILGLPALGMAMAAGLRSLAQAHSNGGTLMLATESDTKGVLSGNTRFALDLYGKLRDGSGNLFFSPFSLSSALAMTAAGAKGETSREMIQTLHLPEGKSTHASFRKLNESINGAENEPARPYALLTANALWSQKGDHFLAEFLTTARDDYDAGLNEVDFRGDTEGARKTINAWVEEKTREKIKELIGQSVLKPATALVLTNAIYFKADWRDTFPESLTNKNDSFTKADGRTSPVTMMRQTGSKPYAYWDGGSFRMLELPYVGGSFAMDILLPKSADGLPALEAMLTESKLTEWTRKLTSQPVKVEMPKFRLEESFELSKILQDLGMVRAFDGSIADFSGMTGNRELAISAVIHKAFVDVSEKGTEAAAATAVTMFRSSVVARPQFVTFRADHPFLFLIRDLRNGSVLFLGRLVDPKG